MPRDSFNYAALATKIKHLRIQSGISQGELAELLGCSIPYLSFLENGHRTISFEMFIRVLNVFEISADELLLSGMTHLEDPYTTAIRALLHDCSDKEKIMFLESIRAMKRVRDNNQE